MIIQGTQLHENHEFDADVIIIGSGAGGAVVARELAEEGLDVAIVEEGPYVPSSEYPKWRITQVLRKMGRTACTTVALGVGNTPTINIMAGCCVGGSSVWTGGVCFRVPGAVHREWADDFGLKSMSEDAMRSYYERVEKMSHVETVPESMRSEMTVRFANGAEKLGYPLKPLRRNTKGCCGCSRCNFGCPHGAKQSVDLTYLPRTRELGGRIYADHRVDRLLIKGDRIVGIEGRLLNKPGRQAGGRFTARAATVVVAAGTLHTPLILKRSKVGRESKQVGRNLTLHPSFRVGAMFEDDILPWKGALQSAWTDAFEEKGITLVSATGPINVLTGTLPGVGPEFMSAVRDIRHYGTFGGLVHDGAGGRVRRGLGREPIITYRISKRDRASMLEGIRILCETFLAGGATSLHLPVFGMPPLRSMEDVNKHVHDKLDARRIESISFHPLGTCRMGTDPKRSVVSESGQTHEVRGLWIVDGSIFPSSVGVNTQLPIMSMATRIAFEMIERRQGARSHV